MFDQTIFLLLTAKKTTLLSGLFVAVSVVATEIISPELKIELAVLYTLMGIALGVFFICLGVLLGSSFEEDISLTSFSEQSLITEEQIQKEIQKRQKTIQNLNNLQVYTGGKKAAKSVPFMSSITSRANMDF